jgi:hypothetical protein
VQLCTPVSSTNKADRHDITDYCNIYNIITTENRYIWNTMIATTVFDNAIVSSVCGKAEYI